jgi:hypothetical protein
MQRTKHEQLLVMHRCRRAPNRSRSLGEKSPLRFFTFIFSDIPKETTDPPWTMRATKGHARNTAHHGEAKDVPDEGANKA